MKVQHAAHAARAPKQDPNALGGGEAKLGKNGTLNVRGSKGDDDIQVQQLGPGQVQVTINGESKTFDNVKNVRVNGGKGSDAIVADKGDGMDQDAGAASRSFLHGKNKGLGVRIAGGKGDDEIRSNFDYAKLFGGAGQDDIESSGNDTKLRGGNGDDFLLDTGIRADVRGGAGKDFIDEEGLGSHVHGGSGDDRILNQDPAARINGGRGDDVVQDTTGTAAVKSAAFVDDV